MRALLLSVCLCLVAPAMARAADIVVFAAASLAGPLDQVAQAWEEETGHSVSQVYAGSSALARQVEAGAPADLVFLASTDWMDHLVAAGAVAAQTVRPILSNRMVLIGNTGLVNATDPDALFEGFGDDRIAVALTDAVPAGLYARAVLESFGLWEELRGQLVETDNVRAATQLVALGAVPRGIVYRTEAMAEPRVTVMAEIAEDRHPPIRYPAARTAQAHGEADAFLDYLSGPQAREIFEAAGFGVVTP